MSNNTRIRLGWLNLDGASREARMLAAGSLIATVTSKRSRQHVTLRLRCRRKEGECWTQVGFDQATHVIVEDFDGERIATYSPQNGVLVYGERAAIAARWSVAALLRYLAGEFPNFKELAELDSADACGRCGGTLTDPTDIVRGSCAACRVELSGFRQAALA